MQANSRAEIGGARDRRLLRNFASGGVARIVALVLALVQVPLVVGYLGREAYGFWLICSSIGGWLVLSDFGLSNGLLNALSRAYAKGDEEGANRAFSSCLAMLFSIAALGSFVLLPICLALPLEDWFHLSEPNLRAEARWAVYLAIVIPLWTIVSDGFTKPYSAYQEAGTSNAWQIAGGVLSLALIWLCIAFTQGMLAIMVAGSMGFLICRFLAGLQMVVWRRPWLFPRWSSVSFSTGKSLFQVGIRFFILSVSWLCLSNLGQIILGSSMGAAQNAAYGLSLRVLGYVMTVPNILHTSMWPAYVEASTRNDYQWMRKRFLHAVGVSVSFAGLCMILFSVAGPLIFKFWTRDVVAVSRPLLGTMIPLGIFYAAYSQISALLNALEEFRPLMVANVFSATLNILLALFLVRHYSDVGIVAASAVAGLLQNVLLIPAVSRIFRR